MRRFGEELTFTAGTDAEGSSIEVSPGKACEFDFKVVAPLFVRSLALHPHELGRVDVTVTFRGAMVKWSSIYHVNEVELGTIWRPEDMVVFRLQNVSLETVLGRVLVRGRWI